MKNNENLIVETFVEFVRDFRKQRPEATSTELMKEWRSSRGLDERTLDELRADVAASRKRIDEKFKKSMRHLFRDDAGQGSLP